MGNFYTNITLRGPSQQQLVAALSGRAAYVSPAISGCTVVFDAECDAQVTKTLAALAADLSQRFACPAVAVLDHDDDVLWFQLYQSGKLLDEYNSNPGYFDPESDSDAPSGGDARHLAEAFGAQT